MKKKVQTYSSLLKNLYNIFFTKKENNISKLLIFVGIITFILCLAIAVDATPLLRGPAPYYPDWRWTYHVGFNLQKIWVPIFAYAIFLLLFLKGEKFLTASNNRVTTLLLVTFSLLFFIFQMSLLYFNQAGLSVIVHRIINQDINGYFTASLSITSFDSFMRNFNENVGNYPMFARFHPPASILLLWIPSIFFSHVSFLSSILPNFHPSHSDVAYIWSGLQGYQKLSALFSSIAIPFLSSISIIPLYYLLKLLYDVKTAFRAMPFYMLIPSLLSFNPLNDAMFHLLTILLLLLFFVGNEKKKNIFMVLSGVFYSISIYFTLTFIPLIIFFATYFLLSYLTNNEKFYLALNRFFYFTVGALLIPFILFLFYQFDSLLMIQKIMKYHEIARNGRGYFVWFFYNVYDFLLFFGVPFSLLFFRSCKRYLHSIINKRALTKESIFIFSFLSMMTILNFSGATRGETARVWIPFVPFLFIIVARSELASLTKKQMLYIVAFQFFQVIVFQSVLITLS